MEFYTNVGAMDSDPSTHEHASPSLLQQDSANSLSNHTRFADLERVQSTDSNLSLSSTNGGTTGSKKKTAHEIMLKMAAARGSVDASPNSSPNDSASQLLMAPTGGSSDSLDSATAITTLPKKPKLKANDIARRFKPSSNSSSHNSSASSLDFPAPPRSRDSSQSSLDPSYLVFLKHRDSLDHAQSKRASIVDNYVSSMDNINTPFSYQNSPKVDRYDQFFQHEESKLKKTITNLVTLIGTLLDHNKALVHALEKEDADPETKAKLFHDSVTVQAAWKEIVDTGCVGVAIVPITNNTTVSTVTGPEHVKGSSLAEASNLDSSSSLDTGHMVPTIGPVRSASMKADPTRDSIGTTSVTSIASGVGGGGAIGEHSPLAPRKLKGILKNDSSGAGMRGSALISGEELGQLHSAGSESEQGSRSSMGSQDMGGGYAPRDKKKLKWFKSVISDIKIFRK
ncbi:hypothetical protein HDU98_001056 [Podochytrium sp. JEL0797]|nr:hypothetical protein HDU98_001056 [Podochytrium sp. JEL0797]